MTGDEFMRKCRRVKTHTNKIRFRPHHRHTVWEAVAEGVAVREPDGDAVSLVVALAVWVACSAM